MSYELQTPPNARGGLYADLINSVERELHSMHDKFTMVNTLNKFKLTILFRWGKIMATTIDTNLSILV